MKKLLFLFSCSLLALSAGAQKIEPVKTTERIGNLSNSVPSDFSCDGKGKLVIIDDDSSDKATSMKIWDENLSEEKSFSVLSPNVISYDLVKSKEPNYYTEEQGKIVDKRSEGTSFNDANDITLEYVQSYVERLYDGYYITYKELARTKSSVTYELGIDEDALKEFLLEGGHDWTYYIKGTYTFSIENTESNSYIGIERNCTEFKYGCRYIGEWKEVVKDYGDSRDHQWITYRNVSSGAEYESLLVTQNLFNNDKAYEYIQPLYEQYINSTDERDRDGDGVIDYINTSYRVRPIGFRIVQDNGNILASIKYDDGIYGDDYYGLEYLHFETKGYLVAKVHKKKDENSSEYYSIFYSIDPSNPTSIKAVRTEKTGIKAMPAIARQSEVVNVDVSKFKNPRHVSVVSSNGQTVMTRNIADGQSHVEVQTSGLPAGLYIVKVTDGQSVSDNCKIIIR